MLLNRIRILNAAIVYEAHIGAKKLESIIVPSTAPPRQRLIKALKPVMPLALQLKCAEETPLIVANINKINSIITSL